jgi:hypothetical protein
MVIKRLFFCSSSIFQSMVIEAIVLLLNKKEPLKENILVYDSFSIIKLIDTSLFNKLIKIEDTRPALGNAKMRLKKSIDILNQNNILNNNSDIKYELFISDMYWLLHKVVFDTLLKSKKLLKFNLFDEGTVIYNKPNPKFLSLKESAKKIWLFLKGFTSFSSIFYNYNYTNKYFGHYFVLWKEIFISVHKKIKPETSISINNDFKKILDKNYHNFKKLKQFQKYNNSLIYISGPFYRVFGWDNWKKIFNNSLLKLPVSKDIYYKPHPAEDLKWIAYLKKYKNIIIIEDYDWPIELLYNQKNITFVSHLSSSIMNLKLLNGKNRVISIFNKEFKKNKTNKIQLEILKIAKVEIIHI